jgi:hypothetical protein
MPPESTTAVSRPRYMCHTISPFCEPDRGLLKADHVTDIPGLGNSASIHTAGNGLPTTISSSPQNSSPRTSTIIQRRLKIWVTKFDSETPADTKLNWESI